MIIILFVERLDNIDNKLFTLYIKKYREMQRMTQEELAFRIGKSQGFISQIEKDNSTRSKSLQLSTLIDIAEALDVCPNDLIHFKCKDCWQRDTCQKYKNYTELYL